MSSPAVPPGPAPVAGPPAALPLPEPPPESVGAIVWKRFRRHRLALAGGAVLVLLLAASFSAPIVARHIVKQNPDEVSLERMYRPPGGEAWLGTDDLGRDLFLRLLYGGRISMAVGLLAAIFATIFGTFVGVVAGYYGRWIDSLLMRFTDAMLSIPILPLMIIISAVDFDKVRQACLETLRGKLTQEELRESQEAAQTAVRSLEAALNAKARPPASGASLAETWESARASLRDLEASLAFPAEPGVSLEAARGVRDAALKRIRELEALHGSPHAGGDGEPESQITFNWGALSKILFVVIVFEWMGVARLVRGSVLTLKERDFVTAARAAGASPLRIMLIHLVPNSMAAVVVSATLAVGHIILYEAVLSFLGLGIQPPTPSWGNILTNAQENLERAPWMAIFPGIFIWVTVTCFNFLGDGLRDAMDPKYVMAKK